MPHDPALYDRKARVDTRFAALSPHHRAALAEYRVGMILARCGGRTAVARPGGRRAVKAHVLRARLRALYQPAAAPGRGWHETRRREPVRVARRWAVMAVAAVYAVEVGGQAGPATGPGGR